MRLGFFKRQLKANPPVRGADSTRMIETLEDRRLMSASWDTVQPLPVQADAAPITVQRLDDGRVVTTAAVASLVGRRFEGTLLVTRSIATPVVDGLGAGTVPAGSVLPVRLDFIGVTLDGRLAGTMAVPNLGLVGPLGAFDVIGQVRGRRITLSLFDKGLKVGQVRGTIRRDGEIIVAKFASKLHGDITRGKLRLLEVIPTDAELVLGFRNINDPFGFNRNFFNTGSGFFFSSDQNGLFISFNTRLF